MCPLGCSRTPIVFTIEGQKSRGDVDKFVSDSSFARASRQAGLVADFSANAVVPKPLWMQSQIGPRAQ
jgi:hypothetical protein